jgi:hypothetical protein
MSKFLGHPYFFLHGLLAVLGIKLCVYVCVCVIRVFLCNMIVFSLDLDLHFGVLQIFLCAKNVSKGICVICKLGLRYSASKFQFCCFMFCQQQAGRGCGIVVVPARSF